MRNILEKYGVVKTIGACLGIVGLLLAIIAIFIKNESAVLSMSIIGSLMIIVGLLVMAIQAKENKTLKVILSLMLAAFIITWILPYGYFQGTEFYNYGMKRVGFGDLNSALYYAFNFTLDKVVLLFVIAGFYGVLHISNGYKALVTNLAKKFSGHTILTAVIMSFIIVVLTAFLSQTFIVLLFIPFFMSILNNMKVDKLSVFGITFGSMLVGILGAVYGTDSLYFFNYYLGQVVTLAIWYRVIILVIAFVLYNVLIAIRLKSNANNKKAELMEDPFAVEAPKKNVKAWPVAVVLGLLAIIIVLGYVAWNANWGVTAFDKFHEWLKGLSLTKPKTGEAGFTIFNYLLGANAVAFGAFEGYTIAIFLFFASAIIALMNKNTVSEYFAAAFEGMKKIVKPVAALIGIYMTFVIVYMSPFIPTITNWLLTEKLNPFTAMLAAFITNTFQVDFGYTAYSIGTYLTTAYASSLEIVHTIYVSMYGLVQVFMPTSIVLMIGLSLTNIDYKSWLKYIWMFVVGMLVVLLVFFTILIYI